VTVPTTNRITLQGFMNIIGDEELDKEILAQFYEERTMTSKNVKVTKYYEIKAIVKEITLYQNYPSPFNPQTTIIFDLKIYTHITLKVYNIYGQLLHTLLDSDLSPNFYQIEFDASNLTSGIYIYQLTANNQVISKRMLLLK
jgi:hypothetical protein